MRVLDSTILDDLGSAGEVRVLAVGRSGYARLRGTPEAFRALAADPRVGAVVPNGRTAGAGSTTDHPMAVDGSLEHLQWHIQEVKPPLSADGSMPHDVVVAVLDTGVAYETAVRKGVSYVAAPSLLDSPITAPYDFINDDPWANDDHQHGTHIASIIASSGAVRGMAPGAALMPIKVLDENNSGTEFELVEGLLHAIEHGADIINLSLSFHDGYQPSVALQEALAAAYEAGIFVFGATGNNGSDRVLWPAASPHVFAVGSATLGEGGEGHGFLRPAGYGNLGGMVDFLLPGGSVHRDYRNDGLVDGILAETIAPNNPTEVGFWLMAGTSQATAMASGVAVEHVRAGKPLASFRFTAALDSVSDGYRHLGHGVGIVQHWRTSNPHIPLPTPYVAMLPYLEDGGATVAPVARVSVMDEDGDPLTGARVFGTVSGNGDGLVFCDTDDQGVCTLRGASVGKLDGEAPPFAWSFVVETVETGFLFYAEPARSAMTTTDAFDRLVGATRDAGLADALVGWHFRSGIHAELGAVAPSYSVVDNGSGLASIPLGVVMTPRLFQNLGSSTLGMVHADGEAVPVEVLDLDGSGLASIPLGLRALRVVTFDALGAPNLVDSDGSGLASIPLGLHASGEGRLVRIDRRTFDAQTVGVSLSAQLSEGGWRTEGYGGATALAGSELLSLHPAPFPGLDGKGQGGVPLR